MLGSIGRVAMVGTSDSLEIGGKSSMMRNCLALLLACLFLLG